MSNYAEQLTPLPYWAGQTSIKSLRSHEDFKDLAHLDDVAFAKAYRERTGDNALQLIENDRTIDKITSPVYEGAHNLGQLARTGVESVAGKGILGNVAYAIPSALPEIAVNSVSRLLKAPKAVTALLSGASAAQHSYLQGQDKTAQLASGLAFLAQPYLAGAGEAAVAGRLINAAPAVATGVRMGVNVGAGMLTDVGSNLWMNTGTTADVNIFDRIGENARRMAENPVETLLTSAATNAAFAVTPLINAKVLNSFKGQKARHELSYDPEKILAENTYEQGALELFSYAPGLEASDATRSAVIAMHKRARNALAQAKQAALLKAGENHLDLAKVEAEFAHREGYLNRAQNKALAADDAGIFGVEADTALRGPLEEVSKLVLQPVRQSTPAFINHFVPQYLRPAYTKLTKSLGVFTSDIDVGEVGPARMFNGQPVPTRQAPASANDLLGGQGLVAQRRALFDLIGDTVNAHFEVATPEQRRLYTEDFAANDQVGRESILRQLDANNGNMLSRGDLSLFNELLSQSNTPEGYAKALIQMGFYNDAAQSKAGWNARFDSMLWGGGRAVRAVLGDLFSLTQSAANEPNIPFSSTRKHLQETANRYAKVYKDALLNEINGLKAEDIFLRRGIDRKFGTDIKNLGVELTPIEKELFPYIRNVEKALSSKEFFKGPIERRLFSAFMTPAKLFEKVPEGYKAFAALNDWAANRSQTITDAVHDLGRVEGQADPYTYTQHLIDEVLKPNSIVKKVAEEFLAHAQRENGFSGRGEYLSWDALKTKYNLTPEQVKDAQAWTTFGDRQLKRSAEKWQTAFEYSAAADLRRLTLGALRAEDAVGIVKNLSPLVSKITGAQLKLNESITPTTPPAEVAKAKALWEATVNEVSAALESTVSRVLSLFPQGANTHSPSRTREIVSALAQHLTEYSTQQLVVNNMAKRAYYAPLTRRGDFLLSYIDPRTGEKVVEGELFTDAKAQARKAELAAKGIEANLLDRREVARNAKTLSSRDVQQLEELALTGSQRLYEAIGNNLGLGQAFDPTALKANLKSAFGGFGDVAAILKHEKSNPYLLKRKEVAGWKETSLLANLLDRAEFFADVQAKQIARAEFDMHMQEPIFQRQPELARLLRGTESYALDRGLDHSLWEKLRMRLNASALEDVLKQGGINLIQQFQQGIPYAQKYGITLADVPKLAANTFKNLSAFYSTGKATTELDSAFFAQATREGRFTQSQFTEYLGESPTEGKGVSEKLGGDLSRKVAADREDAIFRAFQNEVRSLPAITDRLNRVLSFAMGLEVARTKQGLTNPKQIYDFASMYMNEVSFVGNRVNQPFLITNVLSGYQNMQLLARNAMSIMSFVNNHIAQFLALKEKSDLGTYDFASQSRKPTSEGYLNQRKALASSYATVFALSGLGGLPSFAGIPFPGLVSDIIKLFNEEGPEEWLTKTLTTGMTALGFSEGARQFATRTLLQGPVNAAARTDISVTAGLRGPVGIEPNDTLINNLIRVGGGIAVSSFLNRLQTAQSYREGKISFMDLLQSVPVASAAVKPMKRAVDLIDSGDLKNKYGMTRTGTELSFLQQIAAFGGIQPIEASETQKAFSDRQRQTKRLTNEYTHLVNKVAQGWNRYNQGGYRQAYGVLMREAEQLGLQLTDAQVVNSLVEQLYKLRHGEHWEKWPASQQAAFVNFALAHGKNPEEVAVKEDYTKLLIKREVLQRFGLLGELTAFNKSFRHNAQMAQKRDAMYSVQGGQAFQTKGQKRREAANIASRPVPVGLYAPDTLLAPATDYDY